LFAPEQIKVAAHEMTIEFDHVLKKSLKALLALGIGVDSR